MAIFISFYKLFLEGESFHKLKRLYLIASLTLAFIIPLITITYYIEVPSAIIPITNYVENQVINNQSPIIKKTNYLPLLIVVTYFFGVILFASKFIINLFKIILLIKKNLKYKKQNITYVLVQQLKVPCTFFHYIFLNKQDYENHKTPKEVLLHEESHAKQKHSIDIVFIELLQVIFWFNPLIYIFKKAIKLNHEFLADQAVIKSGIQATIYQQILLSFSLNSTYQPLTNAINYSSIKKRFTIMKKQTSQKIVWFKSLMLLPLLAISIYLFGEKVFAQKTQENQIAYEPNENIPTQKIEENKITLLLNHKNKILFEEEKKVFNLSELKTFIDKKFASSSLVEKENVKIFIDTNNETKMGFITDVKSIFLDLGIYNINNKPASILDVVHNNKLKNDSFQQKATAKMVAEYNNLAKKYHPRKDNNIWYHSNEVERMTHIYNIMDEGQQEKAEPFPDITPPPPPLPPTSPISPTEIVKPLSPAHPLPPSPPLDHVKEMAKKGAKFYYNGKAISSDEAITIMKKNKNLNVNTSHSNNDKPIVKISTAPIILK